MPTCNLLCHGEKDSCWGADFRERDYCFLGSLLTTPFGKTCLWNGWRRKCFRCNVWYALKLKEEGCSSSDITVKRHKVQQHIYFLRPNAAPWLHHVQVRADSKRTYSPLLPSSSSPSLHSCFECENIFLELYQRTTKCCHLIWTITGCLMCCKYKIIPSLEGSPRILQEILVKIWSRYQEFVLEGRVHKHSSKQVCHIQRFDSWWT